jgi:hypothetical protein
LIKQGVTDLWKSTTRVGIEDNCVAHHLANAQWFAAGRRRVNGHGRQLHVLIIHSQYVHFVGCLSGVTYNDDSAKKQAKWT